MNAQTQDQSYFKMIAEHQELATCVLRLHKIINMHPCVKHMPTEASILINEMHNIVMTGKKQPKDINELPFLDPEICVEA